ncbi:MAG: gamma-glutamyl-phosphate reductase, partial [Actinomycetota bacterium]|nr:gamma-glutamyl-phosphate reductase [Actinomycetota bacterium]
MNEVIEVATRARAAAARLAPLPRKAKDAALHAMADALVEHADRVLAANAEDVTAGREAGTSEALLDRLALTPARIEAMADGLRHVATLPDPVGEVVRGSSLPNG